MCCCMQESEEDGREVTMLGCHNFCKDCIMPWLENHNDTCPVCRNKIVFIRNCKRSISL